MSEVGRAVGVSGLTMASPKIVALPAFLGICIQNFRQARKDQRATAIVLHADCKSTANRLHEYCTLCAERLQLRRPTKKYYLLADGHQRTLTENLPVLRSLITPLAQHLSRGTRIDYLQS